VLTAQFARFREVCNVFAPLYRQIKIDSIRTAAAVTGGPLAYGDVRDAFAYYMAHFNNGRPFVLVGHSQGAVHLTALLQREFDNDPDLRSRLLGAYLVGGRVGVPEGADIGGSLQNIPLCRRPDQTGCVVAYASYAESAPPGRGALFGNTIGGSVAGCVNPAAPGGGTAPLRNYSSSTGVSAPNGAPITTPYVSMPGAFTAECVAPPGFSYLEIGYANQPGDVRQTAGALRDLPGWGLHLSEVNLTLGNLLDLVRSQFAAFKRP
jgi:hypothetical protein